MIVKFVILRQRATVLLPLGHKIKKIINIKKLYPHF